MAQLHNGAIRNDSLLPPGPSTLRLFDVKSTYDIRKTYCQSISAEITGISSPQPIEYYF